MSTHNRIRWNCPHCDQLYKSPRGIAGESMRCLQCDAPVQVPVPADASPAGTQGSSVAAGQNESDGTPSGRAVVLGQVPDPWSPAGRIRWNCPECNQLYKTPGDAAGEEFCCLTCHAPVRVPIPERQNIRLRWSCGDCNLTFQTTPALAGQVIECPSCQAAIEVPHGPASSNPA